jgi:hypothetical protein
MAEEIAFRSSNRLTSSPHFPQIINEYQRLLARDGRVNGTKFYDEQVKPLINEYSRVSFYKFLRRFKDGPNRTGVINQNAIDAYQPVSIDNPSAGTEALLNLQKTFTTNQEATAAIVAAALKISADALIKVLNNPESLSLKDRIALGAQIMKSQDSRVRAIATVKQDKREQDKAERAFQNAAYEE